MNVPSNTKRLLIVLSGYFATVVMIDNYLTQAFTIEASKQSMIVMVVAAVIFHALVFSLKEIIRQE